MQHAPDDPLPKLSHNIIKPHPFYVTSLLPISTISMLYNNNYDKGSSCILVTKSSISTASAMDVTEESSSSESSASSSEAESSEESSVAEVEPPKVSSF